MEYIKKIYVDHDILSVTNRDKVPGDIETLYLEFIFKDTFWDGVDLEVAIERNGLVFFATLDSENKIRVDRTFAQAPGFEIQLRANVTDYVSEKIEIGVRKHISIEDFISQYAEPNFLTSLLNNKIDSVQVSEGTISFYANGSLKMQLTPSMELEEGTLKLFAGEFLLAATVLDHNLLSGINVNSLYQHVTSDWLTEINEQIVKAHEQNTDFQLKTPSGSVVVLYVDEAGAVHIDGDLVHNGSVVEVHAEHVYTSDNWICLRDGATVGLAEGEYTGLKATKYNGVDDGWLVFDKDGTAYVGDLNKWQPLMTRAAAEDMVGGDLLSWDADNLKAITTPIANFIKADNQYGTSFVSDFNTITKSGFYRGSNVASNSPFSGSEIYVLHINKDGSINYAQQIGIRLVSGSTQIKYRQKFGGVWTVWSLNQAITDSEVSFYGTIY